MRAIVIKDFRDLKEDVLRHAGDTFEVTRERFNEIHDKLGDEFVKAETPRKKKEDFK